jgi:hypothetical protein
MANLFTKEELLQFNELLLGRGMPVMEDGVGYNKADYGACATYFYGLSDAQYADLAKRLVKYCKTQLGVDKDKMRETAKHLAEIARDGDRSNGISLNITENGTLISFRYNETFIEIIKKQPQRQWDAENKNWIIPNGNLIKALQALEVVGADVKNAVEYAQSHELIKNSKEKKAEKIIVKCWADGQYTNIKFKYDAEIVETVKSLEDRRYNPDNKSWRVRTSSLEYLTEALQNKADFKLVQQL